jgi:hypothetical protein
MRVEVLLLQLSQLLPRTGPPAVRARLLRPTADEQRQPQ